MIWLDWIIFRQYKQSDRCDWTKGKKNFLGCINISCQKVDLQQWKIGLDFKYPYVKHKIEWNGPNNKSEGYKSVNGQISHLVNTALLQPKGKKTEIEIVSEHVTSAKKV